MGLGLRSGGESRSDRGCKLNDLAPEPLWPALPVRPRPDEAPVRATGWYDPDSSAFNDSREWSSPDASHQREDVLETAGVFIDWT